MLIPLSLGHPAILNSFKTVARKTKLHHLLKPCAVTAKSISAKSRTSYHHFQLQRHKNSDSDIASIENKLAQMVNKTKVRSSKYLVIKKHQPYKEIRDKMLEFYCYSSWTKQKTEAKEDLEIRRTASQPEK